MTELLSNIETPSDAELISRVRGGDVAAYGELFSRHVDAANRLGRQLARGPDVDDLVSEAFAKVLQVLQGGGGPDVAFRAYLLTSVRRLHVDRVRASSKLQTSDDMTQFDPGIPFQDTAVADFENGAAAKAFASLPERWQLVLWHLEVEGQKPADIAPLLGMSANSVSALAYRAREGLRQAFLTMHLADISADNCRWVNEHLGGYVRKGLSRRDSTKVESHLDECRRCMAMYLELTEVNSNLAGIIAPLLLGAAAASYCASTGAAAGITGVSALIGRARDFVAANAGASTAGAVAAGVAAVATAGVMVLGPDTGRVISADKPITETTSLPNSAPVPDVVEPPIEVEERTAPERDVSSDDETADAAGDTLDEHESLDDSVVDVPVAVPGDVDGAPDGGTVSEPDAQPGNGQSDDAGSDTPGQGGPDGPGGEGPGGPGTDGPGTDGPGDQPGEPGTDGPGQQPGEPETDGPGEQPGTDEPDTDEPNEEPTPTNPGPGPEENPGGDPTAGPDEDDDNETPPGGNEESPGTGHGDGDTGGGDTGGDGGTGGDSGDGGTGGGDGGTGDGDGDPSGDDSTGDDETGGDETGGNTLLGIHGDVTLTPSVPGTGVQHLYMVSIDFTGVDEGETLRLTLGGSARFCGDSGAGCQGTGTTTYEVVASGDDPMRTTLLVWLPGADAGGTLLTATDGSTSIGKTLSPGTPATVPVIAEPSDGTVGGTLEERTPPTKVGNSPTPLGGNSGGNALQPAVDGVAELL